MRELPTFIAATSCYTGIIIVSWGLSFPSPTSRELLELGLLNQKNFALFASMIQIGGAASVILTVFFVKKPEINIIVITGTVIGGIGWYLIASADSAVTLIAAMFLLGIQNKLFLACFPGYLAELTLNNRKKVYSASIGFMFRIGVLLAYFVGIWLPFRWLAITGIVLELLLVCIVFTNPYSPAWLVQKHLTVRAKASLLYLHGDSFDADQEVVDIKGRLIAKRETWWGAIKALRNKKVLKPILIVSLLTFFKETGGHDVMVTFSSHILEVQASLEPNVAALFYPVFLIIGGIISLSIVSRCNLRLMLILTTLLQALAHLSMVIYFFVTDYLLHCNTTMSNNICSSLAFWPIASIAFYAFSFSLGWGTIIFLLYGVLFTSYQEISMIIMGLVKSISSFITIIAFYYLLEFAGGFFAFLLLLFALIMGLIFQYFYVYI